MGYSWLLLTSLTHKLSEVAHWMGLNLYEGILGDPLAIQKIKPNFIQKSLKRSKCQTLQTLTRQLLQELSALDIYVIIVDAVKCRQTVKVFKKAYLVNCRTRIYK